MDKYFDYIFSSVVEDVQTIPLIFFGYQYGAGIIMAFFWIVWIVIKNMLLLLPMLVLINMFFSGLSSVVKIKINKN